MPRNLHAPSACACMLRKNSTPMHAASPWRWSRACTSCARRLHSNLMSGLLPLMARAEAERTAEGIAALIDGLYIRRALREGLPNPASAAALIEDYVTAKLGAAA